MMALLQRAWPCFSHRPAPTFLRCAMRGALPSRLARRRRGLTGGGEAAAAHFLELEVLEGAGREAHGRGVGVQRPGPLGPRVLELPLEIHVGRVPAHRRRHPIHTAASPPTLGRQAMAP